MFSWWIATFIYKIVLCSEAFNDTLSDTDFFLLVFSFYNSYTFFF